MTASCCALRIASSFSARVSSSTARICAASSAAFAAPSMATVATGIPLGICTVDSSASSPSSVEDLTGIPITGSVVCAASAPARCAALPAAAMIAYSVFYGVSVIGVCRRPMRRINMRLKGNAQLFQLLKCPFQHRQVTVAAHDDCNFLHESRNLLRRQANKRAPPVQSPERCAPATACPRKEREPIITAPLHFVMTFPPPSPISQTAHPAPFGYTLLYRILPPLSSVFPNILCKVLFSVWNLCFFPHADGRFFPLPQNKKEEVPVCHSFLLR